MLEHMEVSETIYKDEAEPSYQNKTTGLCSNRFGLSMKMRG